MIFCWWTNYKKTSIDWTVAACWKCETTLVAVCFAEYGSKQIHANSEQLGKKKHLSPSRLASACFFSSKPADNTTHLFWCFFVGGCKYFLWFHPFLGQEIWPFLFKWHNKSPNTPICLVTLLGTSRIQAFVGHCHLGRRSATFRIRGRHRDSDLAPAAEDPGAVPNGTGTRWDPVGVKHPFVGGCEVGRAQCDRGSFQKILRFLISFPITSWPPQMFQVFVVS